MNELLFNLSCNLIASTIFLFIVFVLLRPRIAISEIIAKSDSGADGQPLFFFKVCNRSFFRAYDIKIELYQVSVVRNSGNHLKLQSIEIYKSILTPPSLGKFPLADRFQKARQGKNYEFALQFRTKDDLESILGDNHKFVRLQIEARHGLTGLQSIFVQDYDDKSCVMRGAFQSGKNFKIKH
ncbi:hypothetical protein [Dyadobacter sp. MSC1_007]|jgi:hypothetical protein|uniref:hypothetical protein n=1 Tax=Dyadobacter sp. MSC1_007 TaxID=2909264 RepID=UPI002030E19C|nr:hypothetical protein [Dyadobacter sp. MSC1_007]